MLAKAESENRLDWIKDVFVNTDMLQNIIAEIFGILITILGVDRVITWREKRKWKQAKNYAYVKVIRGVGNLIYDILPKEYLKICDQIYYFGDLSGSPPYLINEKFDPKSRQLSEKIMRNLYNQMKEVLNILGKHEDNIDRLISNYSNLLEDDITLPLILLKERIEYIRKSTLDPQELDDTLVKGQIVKRLSRDLLSFVEISGQLQASLLKKADRVQTLMSVLQESLDIDNIDKQDFDFFGQLENELPSQKRG